MEYMWRCIHIARHLLLAMHPPVSTTVWKCTTRLLIGPLIPDTAGRVGSAPNALILLVTLFQSFLRWIHTQLWDSRVYVQPSHKHPASSYNEEPPHLVQAPRAGHAWHKTPNSTKLIGLLVGSWKVSIFQQLFFLVHVTYIHDLHEESWQRFPVRGHFLQTEKD